MSYLNLTSSLAIAVASFPWIWIYYLMNKMLFSRLKQVTNLAQSKPHFTQKRPSTSDSSRNTMKGRTKSWTSITQSLINKTFLWPQPGLATSEITSISRPPLTTGSIKIDFTTSTKPTSEGHRYTCSVLLTMLASPIWPVSTLSQSSVDLMDGLDMIETPILKSTFPKFLPEKSFRLSGTELPSSSEG